MTQEEALKRLVAANALSLAAAMFNPPGKAPLVEILFADAETAHAFWEALNALKEAGDGPLSKNQQSGK